MPKSEATIEVVSAVCATQCCAWTTDIKVKMQCNAQKYMMN